MVEVTALDRRPPAGLATLDRQPPAGLAPLPQSPGVTITLAPPMQRWIFRGSADAARACGSTFGVDLPERACHAVAAGGKAALWLGPDEWLLLSPPGTEFDPRGLPAPHSVVNVSHRQLGIEISGAGAGALLNAHVNLDFDTNVDANVDTKAGTPTFTAGMSSRTLLGKAEIVLWRRSDEVYHMEVWRSFAVYIMGMLAEACRDGAE